MILDQSNCRIQNVKAGVDFTTQFMRVWNARLRRQKPPTEEETISKINMGDPDLVYRKVRVREFTPDVAALLTRCRGERGMHSVMMVVIWLLGEECSALQQIIMHSLKKKLENNNIITNNSKKEKDDDKEDDNLHAG